MTKKPKRETVGKIATDLIQKEPETKSPIELEREMHTDFEKNVWECVDRCKKDFPGDFYVIVITKKERLLPNVVRNYFTGRLSCPTPDYDQVVYKYTPGNDHIELLWVIPDRETCHIFKNNSLNIIKEERQLLQYVLDFSDGTLFKLAKKLNGEKADSPIIEG